VPSRCGGNGEGTTRTGAIIGTTGTHLRGLRLLVAGAAALTALVLGTDQAKANHVTCGDTITADVTLDSDLINCPNNGILIGADQITLDLNGHRVDGDNELVDPCPESEFCDFGIVNDGHDGVTIKDGSVKQFGQGVAVFGAKRNRLRAVSAVGNTFNGILMFRAARSRVRRSTASENGLTTDFPGMALIESNNNRIARNTLSGNGDLGLFMVESNRNHIRYNAVRGNPEDGMIIHGDGNKIVRNRLSRNGGGILITIVTDHRRAVGNVIRRNRVRGARRDGIAIDSVPKRTLITGNRVFGSGGDGIDVESSKTKLSRNHARRNHDLGIEAVPGVIDGGGNKAHANGDPRQCTNVSCA
jgi:parallel beta-helix repeat protein